MDEEAHIKLFAKYLAGECSEEEADLVRDWITHKPGVAERMARLQRIWGKTEASPSQWDAEAAWSELQSRIEEERTKDESTLSRHGREQAQARPAKRPSRRSHDRASRSSRQRLVRTAAVGFLVMALVLVATLVGDSISLGLGEAEAKVFHTDKGQQSTVRLTDGTRVQLNANSRLIIPESFEENRREVRLEGEAFFEVVTDKTRPFIVHAKDASVQVLGTAFNVQSYSGDEATRVAVSKGTVALQLKALSSNGQAVKDRAGDTVLRPRSLASASNERLETIRKNVDLSKELAWTEGKLVFEDAPFEEVAQKLERWYDIEVKVTVPAKNIVGLNATFEDASLKEVLRDITTALELKYQRDGEEVTFYR